MNLAAKNFIATLEEKQIKHTVNEREKDTVIEISYNLSNTSATVCFFVDDDNKHVAIRCFSFIKVNKDKYANALIACNQANIDWRWLKFYIDNDMEVSAADDAIISADTAGEELLELMHRMLDIVDDVYPDFMKKIWA